MKNGTTLIAMTALAFLLGACGESSMDGDGESAGVAGIQDREETGEATGEEHMAEGTLNSVDAAAGTVNISHEPVESIGWPAMTMNFTLADPDAVAELTPGQRIAFRFTTDGGGTVTAIEPAE